MESDLETAVRIYQKICEAIEKIEKENCLSEDSIICAPPWIFFNGTAYQQDVLINEMLRQKREENDT